MSEVSENTTQSIAYATTKLAYDSWMSNSKLLSQLLTALPEQERDKFKSAHTYLKMVERSLPSKNGRVVLKPKKVVAPTVVATEEKVAEPVKKVAKKGKAEVSPTAKAVAEPVVAAPVVAAEAKPVQKKAQSKSGK